MAGRTAGVFGFELDADRDLNRLRAGAGPRGRLRVRLTDDAILRVPYETMQLTRSAQDGEPLLLVGRAAEALVVWCRSVGSARIDAAGGVVACCPEGDADSWEDRLLNLFVPVLLVDRGELILHGAAVWTPAGAVVVCGHSGRGKSTLTAALGAAGMPVLAEDAVSLTAGPDGVLVWPGPTGVRLDAATARTIGLSAPARSRGKQIYFPAERAAGAEPVRLAAIAVLEPRGGGALRVRRLDTTVALAELFPHLFRLERDTWQRAFDRTAQLVESVDCHTARLPDDLARLARLAPQLIAELTQAVRPAA